MGHPLLDLRAAGACCWLSAGLDPVRPAADALGGPGRRAQHRLGQHRRHQRPAHGPQRARRADAAARPAQGHGCRAPRLRGRQALRRLSRPTSCSYVAGLGAFLGHLFPVWLRFLGGKGVATYIGVLIGLHWPAAVVFCLVWIGAALVVALFLARRARRHRGGGALLPAARPGRPAVHPDHVDTRVREAPRQHPPPDCRRGDQDWRPSSARPAGPAAEA